MNKNQKNYEIKNLQHILLLIIKKIFLRKFEKKFIDLHIRLLSLIRKQQPSAKKNWYNLWVIND